MLISYAICTHDERDSIRALMRQLIRCLFRVRHPGTQYEIVILDDFSQDGRLQASFRRWTRQYRRIRVHQRRLMRDFAAQKNALLDLCRGEFVVSLDADEFVSAEWIAGVPERIKAFPEISAFGVPRMNIFEGVTAEDAARIGFSLSTVDGQTLVNWPDTQWRIFRRSPLLRWTNPVHEIITIANVASGLQVLPADPANAILHRKQIERVRQSTAFYDGIVRERGVRVSGRWGAK
jgi:glycosyltransferase involved in cell wall biosynthesis